MNEEQVKEFLSGFLGRARQLLIDEHGFTWEEGTLLSPSTVELVKEIEESNRQHLIEQALIDGNKEWFMELTKS